jgi:serine/threonine-protein kinase
MAEQTREKISRISSLILMIAILVVAGGASAITAMRLAIRGTEVTVPELTGLTEEEARKVLGETQLLLRVSSKRFSQTVPAGKILEQNPPQGTRLKTDRSVRVLISAGDRKYPVPNLVGASVRAARITLEQRNFSLGNASMTHTASGEPATVQQQFPHSNSQNVADPRVDGLVSLGPPEQSYVMPDLVGKSLEFVSSRARAEGFQIGKPSLRKYAGVEPGIVMQQKPQAGHRLSKQDAIELEVSQ